MPIGEEVLAKTFDEKEDDFRFYKFKGDINILEKFRYIDAQLDLVFSRLEHLIKLISSGKMVFGAGEGLRLLEEFKREVEIVNTKLGFYVAYFDETQRKISKIKKLVKDPKLREGLVNAVKRISFIEKEFGVPKDVNEKNILLNLVGNIQSLDKKIRVQEEIIKKTVSVSMDKKMEKVKEKIKTEL